MALLQLAGKDGECYCAERLSRLLEMDAREQGRPSVRRYKEFADKLIAEADVIVVWTLMLSIV